MPNELRHAGCAVLVAVLALAACDNMMSPLPDSREGLGAEGLEGWDETPPPSPPTSWAPYASQDEAERAAARCLTADDLREVGWSRLAAMESPDDYWDGLTCATCHNTGRANFLVEDDPALQVEQWQKLTAIVLLFRPLATPTGADLADAMPRIEQMVGGMTRHPTFDVAPIRAVVDPLHTRARTRFLAGACL